MRKVKVKYYWLNLEHQFEYLSSNIVNPGHIVTVSSSGEIAASEVGTITLERQMPDSVTVLR
jgi:hypothetical protein